MQPSQLATNQYTITAAQFVEDDYASKIARGECKVYFYEVEPPAPNAPPSEHAIYQRLRENGGLFDELATIDKDGNAYTAHTANGLGSLLMRGTRNLLVITSEMWVNIE